jgi:hypothetical protein
MASGPQPPGEVRADAHSLIRLRERTKYPQLRDVPPDLRGDGARHASYESLPPSKPCRPQLSETDADGCRRGSNLIRHVRSLESDPRQFVKKTRATVLYYKCETRARRRRCAASARHPSHVTVGILVCRAEARRLASARDGRDIWFTEPKLADWRAKDGQIVLPVGVVWSAWP